MGPEELFQSGMNKPPTPQTLHSMAKIMGAQGQEALYEVTLRRIIGEYPDYLPAYVDLAELEIRQSRINEAIQTLTAGLRMAPEEHILLNDLGMCWLLQENYEEALDLFRQAAALQPDEARYRANMAAALGLSGHYEECLSLYEQVVSPANAHYNLAVLCESRKDFLRAQEEFQKAEELGGPEDSQDQRQPF